MVKILVDWVGQDPGASDWIKILVDWVESRFMWIGLGLDPGGSGLVKILVDPFLSPQTHLGSHWQYLKHCQLLL